MSHDHSIKLLTVLLEYLNLLYTQYFMLVGAFICMHFQHMVGHKVFQHMVSPFSQT